MLGPSTAIRLPKMIVIHMPGGRAPLESGLGAGPAYAGATTTAILGDYYKQIWVSSLKHLSRNSYEYGTHRAQSGLIRETEKSGSLDIFHFSCMRATFQSVISRRFT